jgi:hypothetical protein
LNDAERLVDGLNHHERITRLERAVNARGGLVDTDEGLRTRVEELESQVRRLSMPFYLRWWVRR